jgi:hypothetical protein
MICGKCGKDFVLDRYSCRMNPPGSFLFCSDECFKDYVMSMHPLSHDDLVRLTVKDAPGDYLEKECYSPLLGTTFRSWFECSTAEHIVLRWGVGACYESHIIPIDETHVYLPDFWIPLSGVWLEVKGEWRLGAKNKFMKAQKIVGEDRLLLVPPFYNRWFRKRNRREHV